MPKSPKESIDELTAGFAEDTYQALNAALMDAALFGAGFIRVDEELNLIYTPLEQVSDIAKRAMNVKTECN